MMRGQKEPVTCLGSNDRRLSRPSTQLWSVRLLGRTCVWALLLLFAADLHGTPVTAQSTGKGTSTTHNGINVEDPTPDAERGTDWEEDETAPLRHLWREYRESSFEEALQYTEKGFTTILYTLPPGEAMTRQLEVLEAEREGGYGRIRVGAEEAGGWLVLRKGEEGRWRFTLEEGPYLRQLTADWITTRIGDLRYHSTDSLTASQRNQAQRLDAFLDRLEKRVGYSVGTVDYYLAQSDREQRLLMGWTRGLGSGSGRRGVVKVYGTVYNSHELGHVLHNEIGSVHPLLSEGLAEALKQGSSLLLRLGPTECEQLTDIAKRGYEELLRPGRFLKLLRANVPIYAYAETLMSYWIGERGIDRVLELWREAVERPMELSSVLSEVMGPPKTTNTAVQQRVQKRCGLAR